MIAFKLIRVLIYKGKNDTVIHIRSLGKISFLSLFVVPFFRNIKKFAKYAGDWDNKNYLNLSHRMQAHLLSKKPFFNGPVFVHTKKKYNNNIISCFTSNLTKKHIEKANTFSKNKYIKNILIVIFAGRLSHNRGVEIGS